MQGGLICGMQQFLSWLRLPFRGRGASEASPSVRWRDAPDISGRLMSFSVEGRGSRARPSLMRAVRVRSRHFNGRQPSCLNTNNLNISCTYWIEWTDVVHTWTSRTTHADHMSGRHLQLVDGVETARKKRSCHQKCCSALNMPQCSNPVAMCTFSLKCQSDL